jgi:hypothetical protein
MALLAVQGCVPSLQNETSLAVIELRVRGRPTDEIEIFAIMFGVTASTTGLAFGQLGQARVIPFPSGDAFPNLCVARQTLEFRPSGSNHMTL